MTWLYREPKTSQRGKGPTAGQVVGMQEWKSKCKSCLSLGFTIGSGLEQSEKKLKTRMLLEIIRRLPVIHASFSQETSSRKMGGGQDAGPR